MFFSLRGRLRIENFHDHPVIMATPSTSYPARARSPPYYKENAFSSSRASSGAGGNSIRAAATIASASSSSAGAGLSRAAVNGTGNAGTSSSVSAPALSEAAKRKLEGKTHRKRSSSLVLVEKIEPSHEEMLDQSAGYNYNAEWVNYKGAWVIHVVLILFGKILIDVVPGMGQDASWTIVNLGYMALSYLMFHYVTGVPFESNAGVYDELTLWEQIDEGAQYTPAKKWLTSVPIMLFLVSTHYTRYNPWLFTLNFCALLFVLFPKLPILHRLRFKIMMPITPSASMPPTPTPSRPSSAASFR